ncbi:MAG TPA: hypothetical protein PKN09_12095 [Novosphingobium sp.]|nr:hypothetical protein [Novosphingobium sp.]
MDWHRTMSGMYAETDCDAVSIGGVRLTKRLLTIPLILLVLVALNHIVRVASGATSWLGYHRIDTHSAPDWMQTPVSRNLLGEGLGLGLPVPAQIGQEVVIHYDLQTRGDSPASARIMVSCAFPCRNWKHFSIPANGSGELVVPVSDPDFYSMTIWQSGASDGSVAEGTYWIGVRKARTPDQ